jgi:hypothetical protein
MSRFLKVFSIFFGLAFLYCPNSFSGLIYQSFEDGNSSGQNQNDYGWSSDDTKVSVGFSLPQDVAPPHGGGRAWKIIKTSPADTDNGSYIASQFQRWDTNFEPQRHDRLSFWVYNMSDTNSDDTVAVRFFDRELYNNSGFTVWTTKAAKHGEWTRLTILFSQLPNDFKLNRIDKLLFIVYQPGTYFLDDLQVVSEDRIYQSFEPIIYEPAISNEIDKYGWPWFGQVNLLLDDQIVKEGKRSWWLDTLGNMGGTGIKSQEKKLVNADQTPWHADMRGVFPSNPTGDSSYDRLTFWVYALPENGLDNNMGVQVFDWQVKYFDQTSFAGLKQDQQEFGPMVFAALANNNWLVFVSGKGWRVREGVDLTNPATRDEIKSLFAQPPYPSWIGDQVVNLLDAPFILWTDQAASYGEWTRFTIPLSSFQMTDPQGQPVSVQWDDLNKIQLQEYWTGSYFFDDIRVSKPFPAIDKAALANRVVQWNAIPGAGSYTLEESRGGPQGPWTQIYQGADPQYILNRLSVVWLRVRWQEAVNNDTNPIPYVSDYSDVVAYEPTPVLIRKSLLAQNILQWTQLPQATVYKVERANAKNGPWTEIYSGPWTTLTALSGKYYRVRADVVSGGTVVDSGTWSPVQTYTANAGYLKSVGKVIKEKDGSGDVITLRGMNLGNYLLIEPWMTGIKVGDPTRTDDDWNIREKLKERFGAAEADRLLGVYQNAYLTEYDMNVIYRTGSNVVRLPIYYRAIRDINEATGQWTTGSSFNFAAIDRVIQWCEDRGLYVLLDLHGAPGAQSKEMHAGRTSAETPAAGFYHKLFKPSDNTYRLRTVELWQAIANRYKSNTTVMGYDLINEPFGAIDPVYYPNRSNGYAALWALYNQIYQAIRLIDTKHIVVMESIPSDKDWDTLPLPSQFNWSNIIYQFHYYGFKLSAEGKIVGTLTTEQQQQYLISGADANCALYPDDDKFCGKLNFSKQNQYNVPVLIGEFNSFDQRSMWDLYLQTFYEQNWSWTVWSYKHQPARELWGLYTHLNYNDTVPNLSVDGASRIEEKFAKYDTVVHHEPNTTLIKVLREYLSRGLFVLQPTAAGRTPNAVTNTWYKVIFNNNFSQTPVVVAGIETFNSSDTSGIRMKQLGRKGFEVKIEEDHPGTVHPMEVVSYFALPSGLVLNKTQATVGEAGRVTAYQKNGSQWHTVKLTQTFTEPVVFMQINTFHGRQSAHIRLKNITANSFQFQIEEWDYLDQKHLLEDVSYIVFEKGKHQLTDGRRIEVGKIQATHNWVTANLTTGFLTPPAVISICQTANDSPAVITRQRNIVTGHFEVKLQEEKGGDGIHATESVGYLAAELSQ